MGVSLDGFEDGTEVRLVFDGVVGSSGHSRGVRFPDARHVFFYEDHALKAAKSVEVIHKDEVVCDMIAEAAVELVEAMATDEAGRDILRRACDDAEREEFEREIDAELASLEVTYGNSFTPVVYADSAVELEEAAVAEAAKFFRHDSLAIEVPYTVSQSFSNDGGKYRAEITVREVL